MIIAMKPKLNRPHHEQDDEPRLIRQLHRVDQRPDPRHELSEERPQHGQEGQPGGCDHAPAERG
jgi:hypothetical protein